MSYSRIAVTPSLYTLSFTYCLEGTMHRMTSSPRPSPQLPPPGPRSPLQPTRQCLCAYVRPFTEDQGVDLDKGYSSGTQSWEAPKDWESSIGHSPAPLQGGWHSVHEVLRPARAQVRPTSHVQTMVSILDLLQIPVSGIDRSPYSRYCLTRSLSHTSSWTTPARGPHQLVEDARARCKGSLDIRPRYG